MTKKNPMSNTNRMIDLITLLLIQKEIDDDTTIPVKRHDQVNDVLGKMKEYTFDEIIQAVQDYYEEKMNLVPEAWACPKCHTRNMDLLLPVDGADDDTVKELGLEKDVYCSNCEICYDLPGMTKTLTYSRDIYSRAIALTPKHEETLKEVLDEKIEEILNMDEIDLGVTEDEIEATKKYNGEIEELREHIFPGYKSAYEIQIDEWADQIERRKEHGSTSEVSPTATEDDSRN